MTIITNPQIITSSTTLSPGFDTYLINSSSGNIIINLPDIQDITGLVFLLKRTDLSNNIVTVIGYTGGTGSIGQTIDGFGSITIPINTGITVTSYDNNWYIIFGRSIPNNSFVTITSDTTTTSTTFTPLLTTSMIATGGKSFLINSSFSSSNILSVLTPNYFAIFFNGTQTLGAASYVSASQIESGAIVYKTNVLTPGTYTISLEWMTSSGGTAQILAGSVPNSYHASLSVTEVN